MGNNTSSRSSRRATRQMGDAYPGAADSHAPPTHEEAISQVAAFTGVEDMGVVRRVLQDFNWDANRAAQSLLQSGGLEVMEVTLPAATVPGQTITVQTPRGRCEVKVPEGLCGGEVLRVRLPVPETPPEVLMARPVGSLPHEVVAEASSVAGGSARPDAYATPASYIHVGVGGPTMYTGYYGWSRAAYLAPTYPQYEYDVEWRRVRSGCLAVGSMPPPPGRQYRFL